MDIKDILPVHIRHSIADSYRLRDSQLPQIIAQLSSTEELTVTLKSSGIVIRGTRDIDIGMRDIDIGMLVYNPRVSDQEGLYLVTFIPEPGAKSGVDLVNILREYIC